MSQFNLIHEKWIPVRFSDGTRDELGIRDTLLRAKEITAIEDQSPLVVAALHRFLLAVLYRALEGPTDIEQAKELFRKGLPHEKITAYLEKWHDRFWLFNEKYPFEQISGFNPKEWKAWTKLTAEHNAENAKVLFDHIDVKKPFPLSFATTARCLLAAQTFDLAVAKSEFVQPLDAPSARAVFFIVVGNNLHDTLCFCLKPQAKHISKQDSAQWEVTPDTAKLLKSGKGKVISGYSDLYTWRSRSVILKDGGHRKICTLGFASGVSVANDGPFIDPMLCYHEKQDSGLAPFKFREDKDFWRDFDSLLPGGTSRSPLVVENAVLLCESVSGRWPLGVLVCGQKTKSGQAKVDFWRHLFFALPKALPGMADVKSEIQSILVIVEEAGRALHSALEIFQQHVLIRDRPTPLNKNEKKKIRQIVDSTGQLHLFWATMESHFHQILQEYTLDRGLDEIRQQWLIFVKNAIEQAWEQHRVSISTGDAWAIRALVKSEGPIRAKLKKLNDEIRNLEPQEKST